jgi:hypothetical protein
MAHDEEQEKGIFGSWSIKIRPTLSKTPDLWVVAPRGLEFVD